MPVVMVVTGSSRGIGAATAKLAARRAYDVCVNYAHETEAAEAEAVMDDVRATGRRAIAVQADVANETDVVRLFDTVDSQLGTPDGTR